MDKKLQDLIDTDRLRAMGTTVQIDLKKQEAVMYLGHTEIARVPRSICLMERVTYGLKLKDGKIVRWPDDCV